MSFLVAAALAIAALVVAPLLAHLLRRGRAEERDFPAAKLVPLAAPVARQRARLEDRALFFIRAAMVLLLAALGATPFMSCSRLALDRPSGASVALAIVIDDSGSMRTRVEGNTSRFDAAIEGAQELLDSTREGDAVALVAAGSPARLLLAATTDLSAARQALSELEVSDRDTELLAATQLARSALERLPHSDKRVVLLSDLAGEEIPKDKTPVAAPLSILSKPSQDCGIVSATVQGSGVDVSLVCTGAEPARGRKLTFRAATTALGPTDAKPSEPNTASVPLAELAGEQHLVLPAPAEPALWEVVLDGKDDLPENNACPISPRATALGVGVVSDASRSGSVTGGATLVEQALSALESNLALQPLALAPDEAGALENLRVLVLDDPPGLSPDARNAIKGWLERGRVAVLFAGPAAARAQLASKLEPFMGAVRWEGTEVLGLDTASVTWLATDGAGLRDLAPKGRSVLEGALLPDTEVLARWSDGRPFIARRSVGRGKAYVVGLPVSASESDLALRPSFLAFLHYLTQEAERLGGPGRTQAGVTWAFGTEGELKVTGPKGQLSEDTPAQASEPVATRRVTPTSVGRYRVDQESESQLRVVSLSAEEIRTAPRPHEQPALASGDSARSARIDISPHIALGLLGLLTLELLVRFLNRGRERRSGLSGVGSPGRRRGDTQSA